MPGHDVTVRVGVTESGGARACLPCSKVSMIVIRPPQHGHGGRWSGGVVGSSVALGTGTASSSLALAIGSTMTPLLFGTRLARDGWSAMY